MNELSKSDDQIGAFSFRPTPADPTPVPPVKIPATRSTPRPPAGTPAGGVPRGATPARGVPRGATPAGGVPRGATPGGGIPRPTARFENGAMVTVRQAPRSSRLGLSLILLTLCAGGALIGLSRRRPPPASDILVPVSGAERVEAAAQAASAVQAARARSDERVYSGRFWKADGGLWIARDALDEESPLRVDPRSIARIVVREEPFAEEFFVLHDGTLVKNWPELYDALPQEVRLRIDYARASGRGNPTPVDQAEPTEDQKAAQDAERQRSLGEGKVYGVDYTDKVEAAPAEKPAR